MSKGGGHHWVAFADLMSGVVLVLLLMFVATNLIPRLEKADVGRALMISISEDLKPSEVAGTVAIDVAGRRIDLRDASFSVGSACLEERAVEAVDTIARNLADYLRRDPALMIMIEGHTDSRRVQSTVNRCGYYADNFQLSALRAGNTRLRLLEQLGPTAAPRIAIAGYGDSRPRNVEDRNAAENRRVEIRLEWSSAVTSASL